MFELKLLQSIIVAQALGQVLLCRKSIGQNLCTFQSIDDIDLPFGIFQLETGSSGCEKLQFLITTFRKMRGHFLHKNTDVCLPPQLQTLWLSYFLSAISAKVFQEEHRVKTMSAISILRSFRLYLMCSISLELVLA